MIKLGIFILPSTKIQKQIFFCKKKIKELYGNQKYLSHLPHCTICVLDVSKKSLKIIQKENFKIFKVKKKFKIRKLEFFLNDPITLRNTLVLKINKNKALSYIQNQVLFKLKKLVEIKKKKYRNKKMNINNTMYGYPFIGTYWKPHFTIASLKKSINTKKTLEHLKHLNNKDLYFQVSYIYFFQIIKDQHKLLCKKRIY